MALCNIEIPEITQPGQVAQCVRAIKAIYLTGYQMADGTLNKMLPTAAVSPENPASLATWVARKALTTNGKVIILPEMVQEGAPAGGTTVVDTDATGKKYSIKQERPEYKFKLYQFDQIELEKVRAAMSVGNLAAWVVFEDDKIGGKGVFTDETLEQFLPFKVDFFAIDDISLEVNKANTNMVTVQFGESEFNMLTQIVPSFVPKSLILA